MSLGLVKIFFCTESSFNKLSLKKCFVEWNKRLFHTVCSTFVNLHTTKTNKKIKIAFFVLITNHLNFCFFLLTTHIFTYRKNVVKQCFFILLKDAIQSQHRRTRITTTSATNKNNLATVIKIIVSKIKSHERRAGQAYEHNEKRQTNPILMCKRIKLDKLKNLREFFQV